MPLSHSPGDPVEDMADTLDALQEIVNEAGGVMKRAEGNRFALLYLHAIFALFISPSFLLWGSGPAAMTGATWTVARLLPGRATSLSVLLFAGGAVLLLGTASRSPRWAGVGLLLIMLWYLIISISFAGAVIIWLSNGADVAKQPALYAPGVYAHLAACMVIHLITMWRIVHKGR